MLSPGLLKVAAHPLHGEPVDYQPGQLLPEWLASALQSGEAMLKPTGYPDVAEVVYVRRDAELKANRPRPSGARRKHGEVKRDD
jgi:hypothetical protein